MTGVPSLFEAVLETGMELYRQGQVLPVQEIARRLMETEALPIHCPEHHFIVPAALLLAAHRAAGSDQQKVEKDLRAAMTRAKTVPGGFCGNCGCCGAAVGTGIFASVWLGVQPRSSKGWALVNRMTAASLERVAQVEGPRCCKRVTWLALEAAVEVCRERLNLELPGERPVCGWHGKNPDCRGTSCPFFSRS